MNIVLWIVLMLAFQARQADGDHRPDTGGKSIVITLDDLPVNSLSDDPSYLKEVTDRLVGTLSKYNIPAIGFVNEGKLYTGQDSGPDSTMVEMLRTWVDAGLDLGNHTYSHPDYHQTEFEQFGEEIIKGARVTRKLLRDRGDTLRYFRHPMLHTGNTPSKKEQLEQFLTDHNYQTAPVTIDNSEWIFARAYERALMSADSTMMRRIGSAYIPYMADKVAYYEQQSDALFGRQISQVLLLHANALNGEYLDELLVMLEERSYSFIPLERALEDPAYQSRDDYTGPAGISWIHRWAITAGKKGGFFAGEPEAPDFVLEYSGLNSE